MKIGDLVIWHGCIGLIVCVHSYHGDYFEVLWVKHSDVYPSTWHWQRELELYNESR